MKNNLKILRRQKNLTQEQLASKIGIPQPTYRTYENGRYEPSIKTLVKLSQILECSVDDILIIDKKDLIEQQDKLFELLKELQKIVDKILK